MSKEEIEHKIDHKRIKGTQYFLLALIVYDLAGRIPMPNWITQLYYGVVLVISATGLATIYTTKKDRERIRRLGK